MQIWRKTESTLGISDRKEFNTERLTQIGRSWGRKIRKAIAGFQNTLMFRSNREATPCGLSCQHHGSGWFRCLPEASRKVVFLSMPIFLYVAESNGFLFLLCFTNLVQILHWLSINHGRSRVLKILVLDFQSLQ